MPIYDYVCSSCSTRTEFIHAIDAPAPRFCPSCGEEGTLRKAFVPPAVVFKGSGWAKKDRSRSAGSAKTTAGGASDAGDGKAGKAGKDGKDGGGPSTKADDPGTGATGPSPSSSGSAGSSGSSGGA